jgi:mono/diheme cytochrome c family protein
MRWLAIVAMLVGTVAWVVPAAGDDLELGRTVYAKKCASCHGADGKGNAKMAQMLKVTIPAMTEAAGKSDAELQKFVSEGKKPMPSFQKSLSKDELQAVVHYVKKLAGK